MNGGKEKQGWEGGRDRGMRYRKKNHHENKTPLPPPEANVQCENTHTHRG